MKVFEYTVTLTSDGEPATGLGGENLNAFVPRDDQQRLKLNAAHIKGLMYEQFVTMSHSLGWDASWCNAIFGAADSQSDQDAAIRLFDAIADDRQTRTIARTAVNDPHDATDQSNTKQEMSLRVVEAVPAGTVYRGKIICACEDTELTAAWQLALQSIPAIGSSRSRGAGECVITLADAAPDFAELVRATNQLGQKPFQWSRETSGSTGDLGDHPVVCLRLTFTAGAPVCCPEIADKTNTIRSGFAIPASAVQGVILHRLRQLGELAEATFRSEDFRAWPLLPVGDRESAGRFSDPIRVGLTHRGAKYTLGADGAYTAEHFQDQAIAPFDWTTVPDGAPLKASDGVLLRADDGIHLWKAAEMPRVITAHGVRNSQDPTADQQQTSRFRDRKRNLFTVEAMAPLVWTGLAFLPQRSAEAFANSISDQPIVSFGKGRTVRGHGTLVAETIVDYSWRAGAGEFGGLGDILIAQSPLEIPESLQRCSIEEALKVMAEQWAGESIVDEGWGVSSIRFGWNRTTRSGSKTDGLEKAAIVIDPGAVIRLSRRLRDDELARLRLGIGGGRQRGFGAVSLHPGKAQQLYSPARTLPARSTAPQRREAIQIALRIADRPMPSSSQWSALRRERSRGQGAAKAYLDAQLERPTAVRTVWQDVATDVRTLLDFDDDAALAALTLLSHKAIAQRKENA